MAPPAAATLIISVAAATVSPLLITQRSMGGSEDVRQQMVAAASHLKEMLKNYNTPTTAIIIGAPGSPPWHLPEDSSCALCWALEEGRVHTVDALLPPSLRADYNAKLSYVVTLSPNPYTGTAHRNIKISANWSRRNG